VCDAYRSSSVERGMVVNVAEEEAAADTDPLSAACEANKRAREDAGAEVKPWDCEADGCSSGVARSDGQAVWDAVWGRGGTGSDAAEVVASGEWIGDAAPSSSGAAAATNGSNAMACENLCSVH
jgi:hypothetical protein